MPHMSRDIYVHLLPSLVTPQALAGDAVVVIDVLRATTTMLGALAGGATEIIPCLTIDDARAAAASRGGNVLLGGERGGVRIDGFDLGNSPAEYSPERVGGRNVVFTTTNGTRALLAASRARTVLLGAFTNRSAVVEHLRHEPVVHLLCAGTDGHVTAEDTLLAGALATGWIEHAPLVRLNDEAQLAAAAWSDALRRGTPLEELLRRSRGGLNLLELGYDDDLTACAAVDAVGLLAEFDATTGTVRRYTRGLSSSQGPQAEISQS
ncbi:MAG: 2-phosphosulfolactate phosphatase [Pirellulales bacterium]|nr:2-phosphosulfolactate phosphatase [Pirellulales bacterium]